MLCRRAQCLQKLFVVHHLPAPEAAGNQEDACVRILGYFFSADAEPGMVCHGAALQGRVADFMIRQPAQCFKRAEKIQCGKVIVEKCRDFLHNSPSACGSFLSAIITRNFLPLVNQKGEVGAVFRPLAQVGFLTAISRIIITSEKFTCLFFYLNNDKKTPCSISEML